MAAQSGTDGPGLFKAAQETLKTFAADPKYLGATPGMLSALHTWGRNLVLHPHLHVLVSHGGLDTSNQWRTPKKDKLFPQKPVMQVFRGKFRALVRERLESGELALPEGWVANQLKSLLNRLGRKSWTVHFCNQYVHGKGVAKYLARYVKGGAFNNQQIKRVERGKVRFLYKSHQTGCYTWLNLTVAQFIKRVAEHVPPPRKTVVRYGGLYSTSGRERLNLARAALGQEPVPEKAQIHWQEYLKELGHERACRHCRGALVRREAIPPKHSA